MIAHSLQRYDLHRLILLQIIPQLLDVHIQVPRIEERIIPPHPLEDVAALHGEVPVFGQDAEQFGLAVGELLDLLAQAQLVAQEVEGVAAQLNLVAGGLAVGGGRPALAELHQVVNAGDELFQAERLADVVVAAGAEAFQHVFRLVLGGEVDDGDAVVHVADVFADGEAVFFGQHDVQHTNVGLKFPEGGQGGLAVGFHAHPEAAALQALLDDLAEVDLVFYVEYFDVLHVP